MRNRRFLILALFMMQSTSVAQSKPLLGKYLYGTIEFYEVKAINLVQKTSLGSLYKIRLRYGDVTETQYERGGNRKIKWSKTLGEGYVFCSVKTPFTAFGDNESAELNFLDIPHMIDSEATRADKRIYMKTCHDVDDGEISPRMANKIEYAPDEKEFDRRFSGTKNIKEMVSKIRAIQ